MSENGEVKILFPVSSSLVSLSLISLSLISFKIIHSNRPKAMAKILHIRKSSLISNLPYSIKTNIVVHVTMMPSHFSFVSFRLFTVNIAIPPIWTWFAQQNPYFLKKWEEATSITRIAGRITVFATQIPVSKKCCEVVLIRMNISVARMIGRKNSEPICFLLIAIFWELFIISWSLFFSN